jgi:hypothetical protein
MADSTIPILDVVCFSFRRSICSTPFKHSEKALACKRSGEQIEGKRSAIRVFYIGFGCVPLLRLGDRSDDGAFAPFLDFETVA